MGDGTGLATAANLGIVSSDLDALSLVGTTGSVGGGGGVIVAGTVGPAPADTGVVSTHLLEFSVARAGAGVGFAGEVLVRTGAGVAAVFVPAEEGLGLAIVDEDELNALEVIQIQVPQACPFTCGDVNGNGSNVDLVDFASFALCFGGSPGVSTACACSDLNADGAINLEDFATFSLVFNGVSTNVPPNCP